MIAKLIGKRMVMGVFTLLAAALITFTLVHLQPGSPGAIVAGIGATQDQIDAINQKIGWNQPLWQQRCSLPMHTAKLLQCGKLIGTFSQ